MEKKIFGIIITIVSTIAIFSGCINATEVEEEPEVHFESSVTELINYTLNFNENNNGEVVEALVDGRVENKVDKLINVRVVIEFYDSQDNYIGNSTYRIFGLRPKPLAGSSTTFNTKYSGEDVEKISYVKFYAYEIV